MSQINSFIIIWLGCLVVVTGRAGSAETPTSRPDLLDGLVDPLNEGQERRKFLRAAGIDSELDAAEFAADVEQRGGLARSFDRWQSLLVFNHDNNETID